MSIFFERFAADTCCLCKSRDCLTGEHKVKAAALRQLFGREPMVIGNLDDGQLFRSAQGPKSQEFHFKARICHECNSRRTQPADREFDRFNARAREILERGADPGSVFDDERYAIGSDAYLNVFRYFAKLLCCHLAESEGPRPIQVSEFAIGNTNANKILLHIDADPTYHDFSQLAGDHSYAAHGGLIVVTNPVTSLPTCFRTSLTLGPMRYSFWVRFGLPVALALQWFHKPFADKCRTAYVEALDQPISPDLRRKLRV